MVPLPLHNSNHMTNKSETKTLPKRNKQTKHNKHSKTRFSKPAWGFVLGRRRGGFPMLDWRRNYLNTLVAYRRCVNPGSILIGLRIGRMRQGWYKLALYYYWPSSFGPSGTAKSRGPMIHPLGVSQCLGRNQGICALLHPSLFNLIL